MADKILIEDDVRQIARDEANYAIGKHREQDHEANGPDAESVARTVGVAVPGEGAKWKAHGLRIKEVAAVDCTNQRPVTDDELLAAITGEKP